MSYHLTLIRMSTTRKTKQNNECYLDVEKPEFVLLVGMYSSTATTENSTAFLRKIKHRTTTYDPSIPLLSI